MRKFIITLMAAAVTLSALATEKHGCSEFKESMQSIKIGYLTSEIGLTPEEAQLFWPVYNLAESEIHQVQKTVFQAQRALSDALKAGNADTDYKALTKAYLDACLLRDSIQQKYFEKFEKVLSPEKLAKYYLAEEHFRRDQIRQLHGNCNRPNPQPGKKPQPGK